jgi:hypothetical protein
MSSTRHSVGLHLEPWSYEALDRVALQRRWSKSATAKYIVESFLLLAEDRPGTVEEKAEQLALWDKTQFETSKETVK